MPTSLDNKGGETKLNNNEIRYNLNEITGGLCNRNTPRTIKMQVLENTINMNAYDFMGFDANGSVVRLKPKFYNKRDRKGRFTCKKF
jgi:hypothetical protein